MGMTVGGRGNAWAVALAAVCLSGTVAGAAPVRVSVGGTAVEAHARIEGQTAIGDVLPVLQALGAKAEYSDATRRLKGNTFDGRPLEAALGDAQVLMGGAAARLTRPLALEEGRLVGPLAEVATVVGCRASYAKGSGELRIAPRLTQVEAHAADEGALIEVRTTGPSAGKLQHLADPPRAYVDLPGVVWAGASESIQAGGTGGLVRIRWALFQEWPPVARVVIDLAPGARARMLPAQDGLFVVTVRPATGEAPPSTAPALPPPPTAGAGRTSLEDLHVVLDPAGGGDETGVRGAGTTEKAVTLDVALQAAMALMDQKALVTLTRDADRPVPPQARADLVRAISPDLVVRLVCRAGDQDQGVETVYAPGQPRLGQALQSALVGGTGAADRGASEAAESGALPSAIPAATCVVGCLASPTEGKLLASPEYRKKLAASIVAGIAAYVRG